MEQEMEIKGSSFKIRDLEPSDRYRLRKWADFDDPLLYGYNYSDMNEPELSFWYTSKVFPFRSKYFVAIDDNDHMFAYFGLKEINRFTQTAKLGIVMDPRYVSKGLGTEIMILFLDYFFNRMKMNRMVLEVNEWNKRAIRLYEKLGFKYYDQYMQKFENQTIDIDDSKYDDIRDSFIEKGLFLYNRILKMSLYKEEYLGGKDAH